MSGTVQIDTDATYEPLHDNILVRPIDPRVETKGGLVLPSTASRPVQMGVVLKVGPGRYLPDGTLHIPRIREGQTVIYRAGGALVELGVAGQTYVLVREPDLLATVNTIGVTGVTQQDVVDVLCAMRQVKSAQYADTWRKYGEVLGVFANVTRKFDHVQFLREQAYVDAAALVDTLADLAIYAAKHVTFLAESDGAQSVLPANEWPLTDDGALAVIRLAATDASYRIIAEPSTLDDALDLLNESYLAQEQALRRTDPTPVAHPDMTSEAVAERTAHALTLTSSAIAALTWVAAQHPSSWSAFSRNARSV